jgi:hypothetical protein
VVFSISLPVMVGKNQPVPPLEKGRPG